MGACGFLGLNLHADGVGGEGAGEGVAIAISETVTGLVSMRV